jgi:hypothetical protein
MSDHPYPPPRPALSSQPLPDLPELMRSGGPDIAPAPGSMTAPFRNPRFAAAAAAAGLREADLRRAERCIFPLTSEELTVFGCLRSVPGLLHPILPAESLMLLHGPRGVGLTHLAVGIAVAMATGTSFLGWEPPRPSRVLLLSGTMSATALAGRAQGNRLPHDLEVVERLQLVAVGRKAAVLPNLATTEGWQELGVLAAQAEVVIIDDIAGLVPGGRLNPAAAAGLQQCLANLRRDGKAIVVVQADEPDARRGTRAVLQRLADVEIRLAWPAGYDVAEGCRFEMHIERARHLAGHDRLAREVRLEEDDEGSYVWHTAPAGAARRALFESLMQDGVPIGEAGRQAGISPASAYRWRKEIRTAEAAAGRREKEKRRDLLRWTMQEALAEHEAAQDAAARLQMDKIENPHIAPVGRPGSPGAAQPDENEKRTPVAMTSAVRAMAEKPQADENENRMATTRAATPADETPRRDENENPLTAEAAPAIPKLNRHMRRKLARLERRAGRHGHDGMQPLAVAA